MILLYASYFTLIDGSIIRWSLIKFQDKSVLPEYAPLPKFIVPRHHVMIECDKLYIHLQSVQAVLHMQNTRVKLYEPSIMASKH